MAKHMYPIALPKLHRKPRIIHSSDTSRMSQTLEKSNNNKDGRVPPHFSSLYFVLISLLQLTLGVVGLGVFEGIDSDRNVGRHLFCQSQSWSLEYNLALTCQIFLASTLLLMSTGFEKNQILLRVWIFFGIITAVLSLLSGCCQISMPDKETPHKLEVPFLFLSTGVNMIQTMVVFTCYFGESIFALNAPSDE